MNRLAMVAAALVGVSPLPAQVPPSQYQPSDDYEQCMAQDDAARGIRAAVDTCLALEQTIQIDRLDQAYDRAFDSLTGWDQVRLVNEQRDWQDELDVRCAEIARQSGTPETDSRAFNVCRTEAISDRADWLDQYEPE